MPMRITLQDRDGGVATTGEIPDAPSFPDGFLHEGKVFLVQRIITGRKEAIYRQRVIMTMPPEFVEIETLEAADG